MDIPPPAIDFNFLLLQVPAEQLQTFSIPGFIFNVAFVVLCVVLSFIISGAEVALFSLDNSDLKKIEDEVKDNKILYLLKHPKELLASLIISNTAINLLIILFLNRQSEAYLKKYVQDDFYLEMIQIIIEIFVIILFSEVIPKIYAAKRNIKFAIFSQGIVYIVFKVCYRLSSKLNKLSLFLENKFSNQLIEKSNTTSIDELKHAIELTTDRDQKKDEILMLNAIMDFKTKTIKQVMKARLEIKALSYKSSFFKLKQHIINMQFSRIPVYKKNLDNIIGIVQTKNFLPYLKEPASFKWQNHISQAIFILENQPLEDALKYMKENKASVAIVIDEFGITQGIVSSEDIVEEIVGEITDEFDLKEKLVKTVNNNTHEFNAKISFQEFANFYKIPISLFDEVKEDSNSLAGLLLKLFDTIPPIGKSITWHQFKFTITKANKKQILKIKVKMLK